MKKHFISFLVMTILSAQCSAFAQSAPFTSVWGFNRGAGGGGGGSVTNFSATPASVFDVANSTTTPALSLDSQTANKALMGPSSGGAATPGFRLLVDADVPAALSAKIFTACQIASGSSLQFLTAANKLLVQSASIATADRTLTLPDPGGNDSFVYLALAQTLTNKTLTTPILGANNFIANGDTITVEDLGNANIVQTEGAQTINGVKTLGSTPVLSTAALTANGDTITIQDLGNANIVQSEGAQTVNGVKTMPSANIITHANTGLKVLDTGGDHSVTIAPSSNEAADRTVSLPTLGGAATLVTEAGTQTLTNKTIGVSQLTGTLGDANGGTGQSSYTAGDILVANDSGALVKLNDGTDGQVLTVDSTQNPNLKWATPSGGGGFGGNGEDGAVTKGAVTETTVLSIQATTFTQTSSTTWAPYGGTHINATGTVDFNGTTNVTANIPGGYTTTDANEGTGKGSGPSGGGGAYYQVNGTVDGAGGGGGGCGGRGGDGAGSADKIAGRGGGAMPLVLGLTGSGGGGGKMNATTGRGGHTGGGRLTVCAVGAITIGSGGSVNANGLTADSEPGGGGGGSGGVIGFFSQTSVTRTGNISLTGSDAEGFYSGGGGGGGWYVQMSPSNSGAGSITLTGGGNEGGGGEAGATGQSLIITGTPNLPTIVWLQENVGTKEYIAFAKQHHGEATHWQLAKAVYGDDMRRCLAFCRPDKDAADAARIAQLTKDNIVKFRRRDLMGEVA